MEVRGQTRIMKGERKTKIKKEMKNARNGRREE